jgi:hypothetical protein
MSKKTRNLVAAAAALVVMVGAAGALAALIGVLPLNPRIVFAGGNTNIIGGTLTLNSLPVILTTDMGLFPINPVMVPGGYEEVTVEIQVNASCQLTGGAAGDDFVVVGEVDLGGGDVRSGTLLTGEVTDFGFLDSGTTDLFDFRVEVTGGDLADLYTNQDIGVLLQSESSTFAGNCGVSSTGEAKGTLGAIDPVTPAQGCTPGYWKQPHHFDSWVGYAPTDNFAAVFGRVVPGVTTLEDALKAGGGGLNALARHAVAALLNAANPDVNQTAFPTPASVIAAFQAAFDSGNYEPTKNAFEAANEQGCPLN